MLLLDRSCVIVGKFFEMLRSPTLAVLLDQEGGGRHRAERVLNTEVSYVRYLDRLDREEV